MTKPIPEAAAIRSFDDADDHIPVVVALTSSYEHGDVPTVATIGFDDTLGAGSVPSQAPLPSPSQASLPPTPGFSADIG